MLTVDFEVSLHELKLLLFPLGGVCALRLLVEMLDGVDAFLACGTLELGHAAKIVNQVLNFSGFVLGLRSDYLLEVPD